MDVAKKIYQSYVLRFITRNQYVTLPQPEYFIMQACHAWFIIDRRRNKISLEKVFEILDSQTATSLNRIIKPYLKSEASENVPFLKTL